MDTFDQVTLMLKVTALEKMLVKKQICTEEELKQEFGHCLKELEEKLNDFYKQ